MPSNSTSTVGSAAPARPPRTGGPGGDRGRGGQGGQGGRGPRRPRSDEPKEFDQRILELARVTRVTKGGKRMRFRACVIIGDGKGRVGFGVAKGGDVQQSVNKAVTQAKKRLITIPLRQGTIPHAVYQKFAAADIVLKPAPQGTGIKAGGAVRVVLELAGVPNAVAKILGSANKINNTKATMLALKQLRLPKGKPGSTGVHGAAAPAAPATAAPEKVAA